MGLTSHKRRLWIVFDKTNFNLSGDILLPSYDGNKYDMEPDSWNSVAPLFHVVSKTRLE